jgi:UDP-GlcNAc:undecaprenyl-phosphate GlcNAc-1-phosphate transferase
MSLLSALSHAAFALFICAVSYLLTFVMRQRFKIMDQPNQRSSHQQPTPRSGGVAIVLACSLAIALYLLLGDESLLSSGVLGHFVFAYAIIVIMSLIDDIKQIGVQGKLIAQVMAAVLVVSAGFWVRLIDVPFIGPVDLGWAGGLITVFWIVAVTNAFNFMDGLDSLAGGQAVITAVTLALITFLTGSHFVFVISYVIAAASLGFLLHNLPPARIFMGDTGSQFLGFTFALLGVIASQLDMAETTIMIVPILLFSFLWDTAFTLIRRKLAGDPISAHRTHLYQLLNRLGWSHRQVASLYHGFALLQGLLALMIYAVQGLSSLIALALLVAIFTLFSLIVVKKARQKGIL